MHILEHLTNPVHFIEDCWTILKPGGFLAIVVPNFEKMGSVGYYRDESHLHEMVPGRLWAQFRRDSRWGVVQFNTLAWNYPQSFDIVVQAR
jgi:2-polyprenyl-3-methyl-5-hydroxy-6-metoxy-1,4-benzoquinol methylase